MRSITYVLNGYSTSAAGFLSYLRALPLK